MRKCSATGPAEGQLKILLQNSVCFSRKWRLFLAHRFAAAKLGAAWLLACGKPTTLFSIGSLGRQTGTRCSERPGASGSS